MKIERFAAEDMSRAIRAARAEMGADAVILSNQRIGDQVEVVAASEYDEALFTEVPGRIEQKPVPAPISASPKMAIDESAETAALRGELEALRNSLRNELAQFQAQTIPRSNGSALVNERLMQCGFSKEIVEKIAGNLHPEAQQKLDWKETLQLIEGRLSVASDELMSKGGVYSVMGSTGVGKTTTVVKLAAQFSYRHGRNNVALITTDTHRIGAQEQLEHFARLLGVPVAVAGNASELIRNVNEFRSRKLVLIDTAGTSQRDLDLARQLSVFRKHLPDIKHLLVLSATAQPGLSQEVIRAFRQVQIDSAVITKTDEAVELGSVLSGVIMAKLPVLYLCNGQNIPEDLEHANMDELVQAIYQLAQDHSPFRESESIREVLTYA